MWLILGFAALGFLIGNLVGLTSESVVTQTIGLLFAVMGGSLIVLLKGLQPDDRRLAGKMILSLSVMALLGVVSGIVISENRLLSPAHIVAGADNKYLRKLTASDLAEIDLRYNSGHLTPAEAYKELRGRLIEEAREKNR